MVKPIGRIGQNINVLLNKILFFVSLFITMTLNNELNQIQKLSVNATLIDYHGHLRNVSYITFFIQINIAVVTISNSYAPL